MRAISGEFGRSISISTERVLFYSIRIVLSLPSTTVLVLWIGLEAFGGNASNMMQCLMLGMMEENGSRDREGECGGMILHF